MDGSADAERADADARHLRDLYGAGAEAWCASALAALPVSDERYRSIRMIAKALRWLPISREGEARTPSGPHLEQDATAPERRP